MITLIDPSGNTTVADLELHLVGENLHLHTHPNGYAFKISTRDGVGVMDVPTLDIGAWALHQLDPLPIWTEALHLPQIQDCRRRIDSVREAVQLIEAMNTPSFNLAMTSDRLFSLARELLQLAQVLSPIQYRDRLGEIPGFENLPTVEDEEGHYV